MKTLAILGPNMGARSETFIRRHMEHLWPGNTVIVARTNKPPYCGHWKVESPTLITDDVLMYSKNNTKASLKKQLYHAALYKMGLRNSLPPVKKNVVAQSVTDFLTKHKVDVILGEYLDYSLQYFDIARSLGIPFFAHAHGYDVSQRLKSEEWRKKYLALNETDGIIMMNEYSRKALLDIGIREEKLYTIPYGVPVPELNHTTFRKSNIIKCMAVGRMVAKKAPILLLDSFRRAAEKHPDLHLDYVGNGDLLPAVRQYIQAFGMEAKVTLHGALDNEQVLSCMQQADIFLQHSVTCPDTGDQEGFPVAILEAMAHGLPVISTLHSGIPEAVIHEQTGLLVPEGNSALMADNIVRLTETPDLMQQMGKAGRERVKRYFSWERERESLLKLLRIN